MKTGLDHPDDLIARVDLRAALRTAREDLGLSAEAVARLAGLGHPGAVGSLEGATSWEAWRVQRWARGLNLRVRLAVVGLRVPADDVRSGILRATIPLSAFDADQLHLRLVAADLVRARVWLRMSRSELARRCQLTDASLLRWEESPERSLLRNYQRYARGLGGSLKLTLKPAPVGVRP